MQYFEKDKSSRARSLIHFRLDVTVSRTDLFGVDQLCSNSFPAGQSRIKRGWNEPNEEQTGCASQIIRVSLKGSLKE
ncbi:hypothetical protein [Bartonella apihabitans]|uniref:hypothetical protein n=1 Tax=Bartonella apihabitans TaxID=2750929 RepID=UPI003BB50731